MSTNSQSESVNHQCSCSLFSDVRKKAATLDLDRTEYAKVSKSTNTWFWHFNLPKLFLLWIQTKLFLPKFPKVPIRDYGTSISRSYFYFGFRQSYSYQNHALVLLGILWYSVQGESFDLVFYFREFEVPESRIGTFGNFGILGSWKGHPRILLPEIHMPESRIGTFGNFGILGSIWIQSTKVRVVRFPSYQILHE